MKTRVPFGFVVRSGIILLATGAAASAARYHVAPTGDDAAGGGAAAPFRTMQRAADLMQAGDTAVVHAGVYRETVRPRNRGAAGRPLRFEAAPGERPVLDGTEPLPGPWSPFRGRIFQTRTDRRFIQLFVDGQMMVEARWPNRRFPDQLWDRQTWARAGSGSRYGKMVDSNLAQSGIDWTGAIAVLNVAHQFFTWTRPVLHHARGSDTFTYAQDLTGITSYADKTKPWEDDRYYLIGKLEALDEPGEWFLDAARQTLYVWLPQGDDPARHTISVKTRDYGFAAHQQDYVEIAGFDFFGCTFDFAQCDDGLVEDCRLKFPVLARRLSEPGQKEDQVATRMIGDRNTVRRCLIAWASTDGLKMSGRANTVEDCLVHDVSWDGSLHFTAIALAHTGEASEGSTVRHCTVFNGGNALINFRGPGHVIEYNHVYAGGLACKDVALVYTGMPDCAGGIVRYNWVHGCRTEDGGLGIRGDDQTRRLTVHHNVVWDCGRDGIIVKGDHNRVYHNTVFAIGSPERPGNYLNLHTVPEPKKPWRKQAPLLDRQNEHSLIANNAARTINGDNRGTPYAFTANLDHNYQGENLELVDPARWDFRPRAGSPLIDAGRVIPGLNDKFQGRAPDIGAYESGEDGWKAGITWTPAPG